MTTTTTDDDGSGTKRQPVKIATSFFRPVVGCGQQSSFPFHISSTLSDDLQCILKC